MSSFQQSWVRKSAAALLLCLSVALLTSHISFEQFPIFFEGDIATQDVEATIDFEYIDERALEKKRESVRNEQPIVYDLDLAKRITIEHRINSAFSAARSSVTSDLDEQSLHQIQIQFVDQLGLELGTTDNVRFQKALWSVEIQQATLRLLDESMQFYIIDVASEIPKTDQIFEVHRLFDVDADVISMDDPRNIKTLTEVKQYVTVLASNLQISDEARYLGAVVARQSLQVNFSYDHAKTQQNREGRVAEIEPIIRHVNRGLSIVRKGDRVDASQALMLQVLSEESQGGVQDFWGEFAVKLGLTIFLVVVLYIFSVSYIRKFTSTARDIEAMTLLVLFILVCAKFLMIASIPLSENVGLGMSDTALWFATPFASAAMLMRILTNSETTLVWVIGVSIFLGFGMEQDVLMCCFFLTSGMTAAASLSHTRDRINILRSGLQTGLLSAAVALLIASLKLQSGTFGLVENSQPLWDVFFAITGGVVSAFIALGLLPLFESMGFVTDYKMLELANINHPLLRQLFVRAPGTYHHSMTMAQLSEAAAEAIGANALHVRVACYYHDIGKSLQPHYFIENQRGANPHDTLEPHQSARVIRTHVIDGIAMAKQHGLPSSVLDAIEMHHGTSLMKYFYVRALENAVDGEIVSEDDFRYNGRRPNTREAGIIFLADRVEAACRTLKEPSQEDCAKMISTLVNSAITEGQFEECPLTLRELYIIMDVFTTTMTSIYHHRIEYPKMPDEVLSSAVITLESTNPLKVDPKLDKSVDVQS